VIEDAQKRPLGISVLSLPQKTAEINVLLSQARANASRPEQMVKPLRPPQTKIRAWHLLFLYQTAGQRKSRPKVREYAP
jgi:hypothetical protein